MANFVLLYTGGNLPADATQAQQAAVMQAWLAWYGKLGSAVVDGGNPFTAVAKNIAGSGKVSDGPVGVMATGYTVIAADSLDAAVELARGCPQLQAGGQITVYETFPVM